jgi:AraC-like DNA-binding protein
MLVHGGWSVTVEASWLIRPVLRHVGEAPHVHKLIADRLGPAGASAIHRGETLRARRLVVFELLERLAQETATPDLGLHAIGRRSPETLLDFVCITQKSLGDALTTLTVMNRLNNDASFTLEERSKRVILRQHVGTDQARQFAEGAAATLFQLFSQSTDPAWVPLEVRFPHARPAKMSALEEHFGCPVHFGAPSFELHVAHDDRALPFRRHDSQLSALLAQFAAEQLALMPRLEDSAACATRLALREALTRRRLLDVETVARELKTSVRTLQRRLQEEGVDFRSLYDDARRELAMELLAEKGRTLADVASLLGMSGLSSLHRAIHRWTGQSPSALRRDLQSRG